MLRRRFILVLSPLVLLLTGTAIAAIWLLQTFLFSLHSLDSKSWNCMEHVNTLSVALAGLDRDLLATPIRREQVVIARRDLEPGYKQLQACFATHLRPDSPGIRGTQQATATLNGRLDALLSDDARMTDNRLAVLDSVAALQADLVEVSREIRSQAQVEQAEDIGRFRLFVFGLAAVFILVINVSVIALMRTAGMILRPMEKLIEATRELALEKFSYRVDIDEENEFGELARAYNNLARQLETSEQRKLDTLQQVALTLNHELNNALAIIELQLQLLSRQAGGSDSARKCASQIREGLARMGATVEALKHVRRIVLTDYVSGVKMLDLERSVQDQDDASCTLSLTLPRPQTETLLK